ncbi:MAG: PEP-CTERM/exosortase system-associated acyltransferase [Spiribacter salinus]|uniref:PEP-CTERM/exosortase system-associated acyltransferase n=1 Tax=Spiribacter salinus TaxID=1335746 RepID=A0A540VPT4_9GAMM|nr:MAG: PEP-CTERM/exosortase system-associated acyltransferase [Spiribacter salinus]
MTACETGAPGASWNVESPSDVRVAFDSYFQLESANRGVLLEEVQRLRYQVYCLEHQFEDSADHPHGLESDSYDKASVHTLVRHRVSGECAAVVRLVLARRCVDGQDLPIFAHCADALYPGAVPRIRGLPSDNVAEISRLAVSRSFKRRLAESETVAGVSEKAVYRDHAQNAAGTRNRGFPHITVGLFAAIVQMSAEHGITHWLAVMEPTLLRLLRRFGIRFERIGRDVDYHGWRRPTLGVAADVVDNIGAQRPDIWDLVTQGGSYLPPRR